MVENKQSLNNQVESVLTFNAKSVKPAILERLLFGRKELIDNLEKKIVSAISEEESVQIQIIGKRGMGKSHLLAVMYNRLQPLLKEGRCKIAYLSEDEYGVDNYLDVLIRILQSFKRWHPETKGYIENSLKKLKETNEENQISQAENILIEFIDSKPMFIFLENLDEIFNAIKFDGQSQLRAFLTRNSNISFFCTSQVLSADIDKEDKPFFGFFETIYLKQFSFSESLNLLKELAIIENNRELLKFLEGKGEGSIKAIHKLVKGNPRLLIRFYEFLKADTLSSLSKIFLNTINELKPYFESFIRPLPPLEQKILYYLAFQRVPKRGSEIARDNFIPKTSISKKLSELKRRQLIESHKDPNNNRDKLYEIADPMLRMALTSGENKHGISDLWLDFVALCYSVMELTENSEIAEFKELVLKRKARISHLYFPNNELLQEVNECIEKEHLDEAQIVLNEIEDTGTRAYFNTQLKLFLVQDKNVEVVNLLENYDVSFENKKFYSLIRGKSHFQLKEYELAIKDLKLAENNDLDEELNSMLFNLLGSCLINLNKFDEAISYFEKCLNIRSEDVLACVGIGTAALFKNCYHLSLEHFLKAYELSESELTLESKFEEYPSLFFGRMVNDLSLDSEQVSSLVMQLNLAKSNNLSKRLIYFLKLYDELILDSNSKNLLDYPKEHREFISEVKKYRSEITSFSDNQL